jgi:osmotically inducible lipoprotein OsmB
MNNPTKHRSSLLGALTVTAALALGGCANLNHHDRNTITGAAVGGVAGAALTGGSPLGAVGGAVVGGVIGDQIGRMR